MNSTDSFNDSLIHNGKNIYLRSKNAKPPQSQSESHPLIFPLIS